MAACVDRMTRVKTFTMQDSVTVEIRTQYIENMHGNQISHVSLRSCPHSGGFAEENRKGFEIHMAAFLDRTTRTGMIRTFWFILL